MLTLLSNARARLAAPLLAAAPTLLPARLSAEEPLAYEKLQDCMRAAEASYYNCLLVAGGWVHDAACWTVWTVSRASCLAAYFAAITPGV